MNNAKEAVVTYFETVSGICLEALSITIVGVSQERAYCD
jgi:hypothetical protein